MVDKPGLVYRLLTSNTNTAKWKKLKIQVLHLRHKWHSWWYHPLLHDDPGSTNVRQHWRVARISCQDILVDSSLNSVMVEKKGYWLLMKLETSLYSDSRIYEPTCKFLKDFPSYWLFSSLQSSSTLPLLKNIACKVV